jgi:hypothetical protein
MEKYVEDTLSELLENRHDVDEIPGVTIDDGVADSAPKERDGGMDNESNNTNDTK